MVFEEGGGAEEFQDYTSERQMTLTELKPSERHADHQQSRCLSAIVQIIISHPMATLLSINY